MADTPPNNQLIEYRLDELKQQGVDILTRMDDFLAAFNEHTKQDAVVADRVQRLEDDRKSQVGMWSGVAGVVTGIGGALYALFGGGK